MSPQHRRQAGQSLIEVLVALVVAAMMITALMVTVLNGMKNAQFAQSQSRATQYAQEALDKVKTIRDRNGTVIFDYKDGLGVAHTTTNFTNLWGIRMTAQDGCSGNVPPSCYFTLDSNSLALNQDSGQGENLGNGLVRKIIFIDDATSSATEKRVTAQVTWSDSSGSHESNVQTLFTLH